MFKNSCPMIIVHSLYKMDQTSWTYGTCRSLFHSNLGLAYDLASIRLIGKIHWNGFLWINPKSSSWWIRYWFWCEWGAGAFSTGFRILVFSRDPDPGIQQVSGSWYSAGIQILVFSRDPDPGIQEGSGSRYSAGIRIPVFSRDPDPGIIRCLKWGRIRNVERKK